MTGTQTQQNGQFVKKEFVIRPEGYYKGRIARWKMGESSKKGTTFVEFTFELLSYQDPEREIFIAVPSENTRAWVTVYLAPTCMHISRDTLRQLGYDRPALIDLAPDSPNAHDFRGVEAILKLVHKEYEGKTREEWKVTKRKPSQAGLTYDQLAERLALAQALANKKPAPARKPVAVAAPKIHETEADLLDDAYLTEQAEGDSEPVDEMAESLY